MRARRPDTGEPLAVTVDTAHRGVRVEGDADTFGQRLAAAGSVELDAVPVSASDVFCSLSADEEVLTPLSALTAPIGRLLSVQLLLGMTEGVLAEAREYSRAGGSAWHPARSASALTEQALKAVHGGLARGEDLTSGRPPVFDLTK